MGDTKILLCVSLTLFSLVMCEQELWEKDMTKEIYIENSNEGFEFVNLTCSDDKVPQLFCFAKIISIAETSTTTNEHHLNKYLYNCNILKVKF